MKSVHKNQLPFPDHYIQIDDSIIKKLNIKMMSQEQIMSILDIEKTQNYINSQNEATTYIKHLDFKNQKRYIPDSIDINHNEFAYLSSPKLSLNDLQVSIQLFWEIARQIDPYNSQLDKRYSSFIIHYSSLYNTISHHLYILGLDSLSESLNDLKYHKYYGTLGILHVCKNLGITPPDVFSSYCLRKKLNDLEIVNKLYES